MTFEEYKKSFDGFLSNPEKGIGEVDDIYKELETDLTSLSSLVDENEALRNRVKELQETNVKLFLSRGDKPEPEEEPEEEEDEDEKAVEEFFEEMLGNK